MQVVMTLGFFSQLQEKVCVVKRTGALLCTTIGYPSEQ